MTDSGLIQTAGQTSCDFIFIAFRSALYLYRRRGGIYRDDVSDGPVAGEWDMQCVKWVWYKVNICCQTTSMGSVSTAEDDAYM